MIHLTSFYLKMVKVMLQWNCGDFIFCFCMFFVVGDFRNDGHDYRKFSDNSKLICSLLLKLKYSHIKLSQKLIYWWFFWWSHWSGEGVTIVSAQSNSLMVKFKRVSLDTNLTEGLLLTRDNTGFLSFVLWCQRNCLFLSFCSIKDNIGL